MSRILAVGVATLDIIQTVERYPCENEKVRAAAHRVACGGNAANTLTVLAQHGHQCSLAAVLGTDEDSGRLQEELVARGIDTSTCLRRPGAAPVSCIIVSKETSSRTIVHHRGQPEIPFPFLNRISLDAFDWVHVEARNIVATRHLLEKARSVLGRNRLSVEVEKEWPDIDALFPLAGVLFFSESFARGRGHDTAATFLAAIQSRAPSSALFCTWGESGAFALTPEGQQLASPAVSPAEVVDTVGAGDTFNAGMINGFLRGQELGECLDAACHLAGLKVGQMGLSGLDIEEEWQSEPA